MFLARFDVPLLIGLISKWCKNNLVEMNVIKKGAGYMTLSLKDDLEIVFKDVRHYTSPCNLDKFLKTWEAPAEKGIFPYQKYKTVEEIEHAVEFPSIEDFYSDLKQVNVLYNIHLIIVKHRVPVGKKPMTVQNKNMILAVPYLKEIQESFII